MGCWNETCGVTNLPIFHHDKVALFILKKNKDRNNLHCYSDDLCIPIFPAIIGYYDDYGGIEDITVNKLFPCFVNWFNQKYKQNIIENPEYKTDTMEGILEMICRAEISDLSIMFVHYDMYTTLIKEAGDRIPYGEEIRKMGNPTMRQIKMEQFRRFAKKYGNAEDIMLRYGMSSTASDLIKNFFQMNFLMDDMLKQDEDIHNLLTDMMMMNMAMSLSRKVYLPQISGSQSTECCIHNIIGNFITKKCYELIHENEDLDADEKYDGRETVHMFNPYRFEGKD